MWWYTAEGFVYSNLNRALRTQDTELIMKMGFFIQDIYREVEQKQSQLKIDTKMVSYRGQGLSDRDFEKLRDSEGGLLSFNNFLSTSRDRDVSLVYAEDIRDNTNLVGILFEMEIDPSISSSTFLSLDNLSHFEQEREILFLMHSVFRIGKIDKLEERLWHVKLTLTDDNDGELNQLTQYFRDEIRQESGWDRMASLMRRMGKFKEALEIHSSMLQATSDDDEEALEIARAKMAIKTGASYLALGKYSTAMSNFEEAREIFQRYLSPDTAVFAEIYLIMGMAQYRMADYALALSNLKQVQKICQHSPLFPRLTMALTYNTIGLVHHAMGEYQLALSNFETALEIQRTVLPHYHPDLIMTCNNMATAQQQMGSYAKALEYFNETLSIQQRSLPTNHPHLSVTYCNIASIHFKLQNYTSSLDYCERAVENRQKSSTDDHADMVLIYNNIAATHRAMNNYSAAFLNFDKALEIQRKSFPSDHPDTAVIYSNVGATHLLIGNHSAALYHLEKAREIQEKLFSEEHPTMALTYQSIGTVNYSLGNYPVALSYHEKALRIQQKTLPSHHPDLARTHTGIAQVQLMTHDYLSAMSHTKNTILSQQALCSQNQSTTNGSLDANDADAQFLQSQAMAMTEFIRSMECAHKTSLPTQADSATMGKAVECLDRCLKGFSYTEESFRVQPKSLVLDRQLFGLHFDRSSAGNQSTEDMLTLFTNMGKRATRMKERMQKWVENQAQDDDNDRDTPEDFYYLEEISNYLTFCQKIMRLVRIPADLATAIFNDTGIQCCSGSEYSGALFCFEKALETCNTSVPVNSQLVAKTHDHVATALEGLERIEEAICSATQATEIASSALGPAHFDTQDYRNHLDKLMKKFQFL